MRVAGAASWFLMPGDLVVVYNLHTHARLFSDIDARWDGYSLVKRGPIMVVLAHGMRLLNTPMLLVIANGRVGWIAELHLVRATEI